MDDLVGDEPGKVIWLAQRPQPEPLSSESVIFLEKWKRMDPGLALQERLAGVDPAYRNALLFILTFVTNG